MCMHSMSMSMHSMPLTANAGKSELRALAKEVKRAYYKKSLQWHPDRYGTVLCCKQNWLQHRQHLFVFPCSLVPYHRIPPAASSLPSFLPFMPPAILPVSPSQPPLTHAWIICKSTAVLGTCKQSDHNARHIRLPPFLSSFVACRWTGMATYALAVQGAFELVNEAYTAIRYR